MLIVTENGAFTFPDMLAGGAEYDISFGLEPDGQVCTIENGKGIIDGDVSNIIIECSDDLFYI